MFRATDERGLLAIAAVADYEYRQSGKLVKISNVIYVNFAAIE